jgi:hypothetical protein
VARKTWPMAYLFGSESLDSIILAKILILRLTLFGLKSLVNGLIERKIAPK